MDIETIKTYLEDATSSVPGTEFTVTAEELAFLTEQALKTVKKPRITAEANRERIREFMVAHPGAKQTEIAKALGLSQATVNGHVQTIRKSWMN